MFSYYAYFIIVIMIKPYFETNRGKLYHGDCLKIMRNIKSGSIDSLITDPPYGLNPNNISKRINKIFRVCFNIMLPNFHKANSLRVKYSEFVGVLAESSDLSGFETLPIIKSFISMPESSIDFDCDIEIKKEEIKASDVSACFNVSDRMLVNKIDPQGNKFIGDYIFNFGDSINFAGGDILSSNFGEFLSGSFCMPISSIKSPFFPDQSGDFPFSGDRNGIDDIVWSHNFARGDSFGSGFILAGSGAEDGLILTFDLRGGTDKVCAAITTQAGDRLGNFICPELIRTFATASSLSAKFKPCRVSFVTESANGTISNYFFHLWLPPNLIKDISNIQKSASGFMGKKWDYNIPSVEIWQECLRVLKPGAHALIFAGSRTQHRMAVNIEDAGFILKDCLMWLYGSGFPKSTDISKQIDKTAGKERTEGAREWKGGLRHSNKLGAGSGQENGTTTLIKYDTPATPATPEAELWNGWGTHLKPAYEPILLAMKPNDGTYAQNALKHGVAGLNIDGCLIETSEPLSVRDRSKSRRSDNNTYGASNPDILPPNPKGRFPANVILDEEAAEMLDKQSGILKSGKPGVRKKEWTGYTGGLKKLDKESGIGDQGGASRFLKTIDRSCTLCNNTYINTLNKELFLWKVLYARNAGKNFKTTQATSENIARLIASTRASELLVQNAKCAGSLCDLCAIFIAHALVEAKITGLKKGKLQAIPGYIEDYKSFILTRNLVSFAELWANIDTTPTIQSLSILFGSVLHAIKSYIPKIKKSEPSRFLYTSKASQAERGKNNHPTVKPLKLMEYLCNLTKTPTGGTVLDPFAGSGTTAIACHNTGRPWILIEREKKYCETATARIEAETAQIRF